MPNDRPFWRDPLFWTELLSVFALGALLFFVLKSRDMGQVIWIVGGLLIFQRYAFQRSAELSEKRVEQRIDVLSGKVGVIEDYIDLNVNSSQTHRVRTVIENYFRITNDELKWHREAALSELSDSLDLMLKQKRSPTMLTAEYYRWLLPQLDGARRGDHIWAVSRMLSCEWDDSPEESDFLQKNLAAARRGVIVTRIFISTPEVWDDAVVNVKPVGEQLLCKGLDVYFGDSRAISSRDAQVLSAVGDGLIAFDSRAMLVDQHSDDGSARGYVSVNSSDIERMRARFESLKTMCVKVESPPPSVTSTTSVPRR